MNALEQTDITLVAQLYWSNIG